MRKILLQIMSDYCWLTSADVHKLLEHYRQEPVKMPDVHTRLSAMVDNGEVERKLIKYQPFTKTITHKYVYKLVTIS